MLLAVDIGNSSAKLGLFGRGGLIATSRIFHRKTADADEILAELENTVTDVPAESIFSSVVPEINDSYARALEEFTGRAPIEADHKSDLGISIDYLPPEGAGADRLLAAAAAVEAVGAPCIVCDLGTAATIDAVTSDKTYRGGVIAAGISLLAEGLHRKTSQLPLVEPGPADSVIGNTTIDSIRSGLYFGYAGLVDGVVRRMLEHTGPGTKVIATGGDAPLIAEVSEFVSEIEPNLVLKGLELVHRRSRS